MPPLPEGSSELDIFPRELRQAPNGTSSFETVDRLRALTNAVPGVVYQFFVNLDDGTYGFHFINDRTQDILGLRPDPDTLFERFAACLPDDHRERFYASAEEAVQQGTQWEFEAPFRHPEGGLRWIRAASSPEKRENEIVFNGVVLDITERVQSERRFERLMEHANDLISVHDGRGVFLYASSAAHELTGYAPDDLLGRGAFEIIHPDDHAHVAQHQAEVLAGANHTRFEYRLLRADGSVEWVEVTGGILQLETGERQLVAATRSIQKRKDAEAELRQSRDTLATKRERLEMALRGGDLGLWDCDYNAGVSVINERWASMLGYTQAEVEPAFEAFPELTHPDDYARVLAEFATLAPGAKECLEVEVRMRAADGSWRWILSSGCVMEWNPDGTPKRAVGTHLDITERKRQASVEERFGRLLDGSANEIYIARADTHRLVQVNRGAREGLAYPASDLLDMTLLDLMTCSAERFEEVVRPLHDGDEEIVTFETRHRRADGSTYPVEIRLQFSREETPPVYIAIATDITDRVRYEEGLIEAKRRAEEASRMKSAMVAEVSHDVRAPLTGIIGYADLMMMVAEDDEQQQIASAILRGGERLLDTLNSVLSLSKLDSGEQPNIEPMDGIRVARDVVQDYGPHARAEGIQLSLQTANACGLRSDPVMLQRILSNLVSNAIKFTNASGRVTLRVRPEADGVCFEVEDTGVGMSPAFQERMFNAFEQETETDAGNGLGLSIVKRLVDLLEGTIEVDSRRGEGTRFRITVPSL